MTEFFLNRKRTLSTTRFESAFYLEKMLSLLLEFKCEPAHHMKKKRNSYKNPSGSLSIKNSK